jgi:hypothetical protein
MVTTTPPVPRIGPARWTTESANRRLSLPAAKRGNSEEKRGSEPSITPSMPSQIKDAGSSPAAASRRQRSR